MKKNKSAFLILAIFSLFFVSSIGISNADIQETQARPKIKVGAVGPLAITPGNDMKKGLELALDEINEDGVNVDGTVYDIELIIETSSGDLGIPDPAVGVAAGKKLIEDDDVAALIGGFRTEVVLGIMNPLILDRPFLGVGASAPIISPHFWRIGPSNVSGLANNVIDFYAYAAIPDLGVRNITIIREEAAWTYAMGLGIKLACTTLASYGLYGAGVTINFTDDIVIPVTYKLDDVKAAMSGLKAATYDNLKVNALCTIFSGPVGAYVPQAWTAHDLSQMLAGINVESQVSTFFDDTEGACYGEIELETCPPDVEPNANTKPFREKYVEEYDEEPTYTSFASYDALYVLKEALEDADSFEVADLEASLLKTNYVGIAYTIKFTDENGPHWTVAINETTGMPYYVPILTDEEGNAIMPGTFKVHDLFSPTKYGADARPYNRGYWAQWQKNGVKKTIWHLPTDTSGYDDTLDPMGTTRKLVLANVELAPINHTDHGWTSKAEAPGFELPIIFFGLAFIAAVTIFQRKKRQLR
ncbi:MAG: ABC transporter substrate-binding protein [Candidatus Hodarchaeota archaeon]